MAEFRSIYESFVDLQSELPVGIEKKGKNPFFKSNYVTLDALLEAVLPIVNKHGFGLLQSVGYSDTGEPTLTTRLHYTDGKFFESTMLLMSKSPDPQAQGSAITYARRYALMSMLGLVGDEDDDGNAGSQSGGDLSPQATNEPKSQAAGELPTVPASPAQKQTVIKLLISFSNGNITNKDSAEIALVEITGQSLDELTKDKASELIGQILQEKKIPLSFDDPEIDMEPEEKE